MLDWFDDEPRMLPTANLSLRLDDENAIPYFLWDAPLTVRELRHRLAEPDSPQRLELLAVILREARDTDVWRFTTPAEVSRAWPVLAHRLGRRRAFWEFLLGRWQGLGLLG